MFSQFEQKKNENRLSLKFHAFACSTPIIHDASQVKMTTYLAEYG